MADDLVAELAALRRPGSWSATTPWYPCASWGGGWRSSTASCNASLGVPVVGEERIWQSRCVVGTGPQLAAV